jgi:hypothetical protein
LEYLSANEIDAIIQFKCEKSPTIILNLVTGTIALVLKLKKFIDPELGYFFGNFGTSTIPLPATVG